MRYLFLVLAPILLLPMLVGGCANKRTGDIAYNPADFGAPDEIPPSLGLEYRLGPADVVNVDVFSVEELSGDQQLDSAGRIKMPLLGPVDAAGLTTAQLATILQDKLGERYLTSPSVNVSLKTAVPKTVTVDGSVSQPGIYPIGPNTSLIQTIAQARGTAEGANPRRVVVFRQIDGQRQAAAFDLVSIRNGEDPDPEVFANDIIVVDGSKTSKAFRDVISALPLLAIFRPF